jgi:hypothetical protein
MAGAKKPTAETEREFRVDHLTTVHLFDGVTRLDLKKVEAQLKAKGLVRPNEPSNGETPKRRSAARTEEGGSRA